MVVKQVKRKIRDIYEERKGKGSLAVNKKLLLGFNNLFRTPESRRNEAWHNAVSEFNRKMQRGFDIRTSEKTRINELVDLYKIKTKEEDSILHEQGLK